MPLLALHLAERRERLAAEGSVPDDADALVDDAGTDSHDVGEVGHGLLAGVDNQRPVLQVHRRLAQEASWSRSGVWATAAAALRIGIWATAAGCLTAAALGHRSRCSRARLQRALGHRCRRSHVRRREHVIRHLLQHLLRCGAARRR